MDKKLLLIGVSSIIVISVIILLVYLVFNKNKVYLGNGFEIAMLNSLDSSITPNSSIIPFKNNGFTISFWIYMDDFYENYLYWKHIFHKGTPLENKTLSYQYWYNIETEIHQQLIGLWLHPDKNDLRIALSTVIEQKQNSDIKNYFNKEKLEFCDIKNIPSKTLINYTIIIDEQTVSVFKNGLLHKTCGLHGRPLMNLGDMYFNYQKTYSGSLYNYKYFPRVISIKNIKKLFKLKPTI